MISPFSFRDNKTDDEEKYCLKQNWTTSWKNFGCFKRDGEPKYRRSCSFA
jgi:hypothetical protein